MEKKKNQRRKFKIVTVNRFLQFRVRFIFAEKLRLSFLFLFFFFSPVKNCSLQIFRLSVFFSFKTNFHVELQFRNIGSNVISFSPFFFFLYSSMEYIFEAEIEEKFEILDFEFFSHYVSKSKILKFKYFRILNYTFIDLFLDTQISVYINSFYLISEK